MKANLAAVARQFISPSMRYELRNVTDKLRLMLGRACFWRWEVARFRLEQQGRYEFLYIGRKQQREVASLLMGGKDVSVVEVAPGATRDQVVLVSELPTAGALSVPHFVSAVVPLGRPLDEIIARYDSELRRSIRKNRAAYQMRQALTDAEIAMADRDLLRPYATARQGDKAAQFSTEGVFRLAKGVGRLDLITLNDEVVACHLGCEVIRGGKRYWSTLRFGYCEAVFSDPKKLREVNSMTTFMTLEWALANGFDYHDIGLCVARPDDGLLRWKRRRGGDVDTLNNHACLFVRLPRTGAAEFLWETPLFAMEGSKVTLHLGLPDTASDDEIASRYQEMVFGGLHKIYLYSAKRAGEAFVQTLRSRYAGFPSTPILEHVACR
ncbi:hypothetical protein F3J45_09835 [Pantoea sp. Ap-967]|uniref:hypothetical protein n=1 Tax=Pantoea sp. Ap-967 TaxID=2608362 RepID=UPI001420DA19|nr:hypothetical protein [Pantoea sp. Ap-967]NIE74734.1 hypothetical protein [Pantoea sp. Ap-967]